MSYDLNVWMRSDKGSKGIVHAQGLVEEGGAFRRSARNWQVVVSLDPVEPEDIPDSVFPRLGGLRWLASISLEPICAPKVAHTFARSLARELAEAGVGVIEDPQTGNIKLAKSARAALAVRETSHAPDARPNSWKAVFQRFGRSTEEPRISELQFSWWVDHGGLFDRTGIERFVTAIERHLPEALPRRYGPYEPPKFKYSETGRDAFIDFLNDEDMGVVYPSRPCTEANYPVGRTEIGWTDWGKTRYRAGWITIGFNAQVLEEPNWRLRLPPAWRALSEVIRPFYGEVRCLGGRIPGRATLYYDSQSEAHPVHGPWWRGIPRNPAIARVIGEKYASYWPNTDLDTSSKLLFLESADWRHPDSKVNAVPAEIAQPGPDMSQTGSDITLQDEWADAYPEEFPFATPEP